MLFSRSPLFMVLILLVALPATALGQTVSFIDADGAPTSEVLENGTARIRVFSLSANYDPYGADIEFVTVSSNYAGDSESVTLTETGWDTAIFEGTIELAFGSGMLSNGTLETSNSGPPEYLYDDVAADYHGLTADAQIVGSQARFIDGFGRKVASYAIGQRIYVRVVDHNANDPFMLDSFNISAFCTATGENETFQLNETGYDTAVFEGSVPSGLGVAGPENGLVEAAVGDVVEISHPHTNGVGYATDQASFTRSATYFIDAAGNLATYFLESSTAYVRVIDAFANSNPSGADTTSVDVAAEVSWDFEMITLTETGDDTGIFEGSIPLSIDSQFSGNGILETYEDMEQSWDTLTASHYDGYATTTATATTHGSFIWFTNANGSVVSTYIPGSTVYIRVEYQNYNQPGVIDTVAVDLTSLMEGDWEQIYLVETDKDSGIFEVSIELVDASAYPNDGLLQGRVGEKIRATHQNVIHYHVSEVEATVEYFGIWFLDERGEPTGELLESGTARIRVFDVYQNLDSYTAETVTVTVSSRYAGDSESVTLTETGADTATFEGTIQLAYGSAMVSNAILETSNSGPPAYLFDEVTADNWDRTTTATTVGSRAWFLDGYGQEVSTYAVGERIYVVVVDHNANDPLMLDSFNISVFCAATGENETFQLNETGYDTAVFEGSVPSGRGIVTTEDGVVEAAVGAVVEISHPHMNGVGYATDQAAMSGSATYFIDAAGNLASYYLESSTAYVRVLDVFANGNPFGADTTSVELSAGLSGDFETITLTETGPDTGIFEGSIPLSIDSASSGNGILETSEDTGPPPFRWDTLTASHDDGYATTTATATTRGSQIWFIDAYGAVVSTYATGSTVYVRVEDQNYNQPSVIDVVMVNLSSLTTGDTEQIYPEETGYDTGIFEGSIPLQDFGSPSPSDDFLQAMAGEKIRAWHDDAMFDTSSEVEATIDQVGVWFIDEQGRPTAELLEGDSARIRVFNVVDNMDSYTAETVNVTVSSNYAGDSESVVLTETGLDTATFEGTIDLAFGSAMLANGIVETSNSGPPEYLFDDVAADYQGLTAYAQTVGSRAFFLDGYGQEVSAYGIGDRVYVQIVDHNANAPGQIDSFSTSVSVTVNGEVETIQLTETGYDTAVFEGSVLSVSGTVSPEDGVLQSNPAEVIRVSHPHLTGAGYAIAEATMSGSATYFIDAAGNLAGYYLESSTAYVRVIDAFANTTAVAPETTTVDVSAELTGDFETITLTETGNDTGIFEGSIRLSIDPSSSGNGLLETSEDVGIPPFFRWDTLTASHYDGWGTTTATATTRGSHIWFINECGAVVSTYAIGSTVYVRVEDQNYNQPGVIDVVTVELTSPLGDWEQIYPVETGTDTGIFEGSIPLLDNGAMPSDGVLAAMAGEPITASHDDAMANTTSEVEAMVEHAGIWFIDDDGVPSAELLEAGSARVRVLSLADNQAPYDADTLWVTLYSLYGGDFESLELVETGVDVGVFEGTIDLAFGTSMESGVLETYNGGAPEYLFDQVTAFYHEGSYAEAAATAQTIGSRAFFLDGFGREVQSYAVGDRVHVRLIDHNSNAPGTIDWINVTVFSDDSGDSETFQLDETGLDTGTFEGSIASAAGTATIDDGTLQAEIGHVVRIDRPHMNGAGSATAEATMAGSATDFIDAEGQPVSYYLEGSQAIVRVLDGLANAFSDVVDTTTVDVTAELTGDFETITLTETGQNTAVFEGSIALSLDPPLPGNAVLETGEDPGPPIFRWDTLSASHDDGYTTSTATATTRGSHIWFLDAYGNAVSSYPLGGTVYVWVEDHNRDQAGIVDVVSVQLESLTSEDSESLLLTETGTDTGVFAGSMVLDYAAAPMPGDGLLQVTLPEQIRARHDDYLGDSSSEVEAAVVDAAIEFIDAQGAPTGEVFDGDKARLRVFFFWANSDPGTADTMPVDLHSLYGDDWETLTLTETGPDTSTFLGEIPVAYGGSMPGNGWLETMEGPGPEYSFDQLSTLVFPLPAATAVLIGSLVDFLDAAGQPTVTYGLDAEVRLRIVDYNRGMPTELDSFIATVTSAGDSESVTMTETGIDTSVYEGAIPSVEGTTMTEDGVLSGLPGAVAELQHANLNNPNPTIARATFDTSNHAPEALDDDPGTAVQGSPMVIDVLFNDDDYDGDPIALVSAGPAAHGTVVINPDETVTYTSDPDYAGPDSFTYAIADSLGAQARGTVTLTVNGPPEVTITAPADGSSFADDDEITFTGTAVDLVDGDLTAGLLWSSDLDGTIGSGGSFSPVWLSTGVHTITASVSDGGGLQGTDQITLTVNARPNVYINSPPSGTFNEDESISFAGTADDFEDGDLTTGLTWSSDLDGTIGSGGSFSAVLTPGVHTVTAAVSDGGGLEGSYFVNLTVNARAQVTITAPADGFTYHETASASFAGWATDPEDGDLTANLTWTSDVDGHLGDGGSFAIAAPSVGTHTVTAEVTDGGGLTASSSITLNVNDCPDVTINVPLDGATFNEDESISFSGAAADLEDGDLSSVMDWTSSLDEGIGSGPTFSVVLSPGVHTITAEATDSLLCTGYGQITLTVNARPVVTITAPLDGTGVNVGDSVTFTGSASDTEDGDLTVSLSWTSALDGAIGTGATFSTSGLSVGVHTITASVTDSGGLSDSDAITVTVNGLPTVTITAPADGSVFTQGSGVTFTGTAGDPEDGDLTPSISWTSSLDGAIGTGGSFSLSTLSLGVHTITASVTDTQSVPASDAITVTINAAPTVTITAPTDGSIYGTGDEITFTGSAIDLEEGDLGVGLSWSSDLDGAIGIGGSVTTSALSAGTHTITASVTDAQGAPGSDLITVIVKVPVQVTFTSIAAEDGWVRESSETSGSGGKVADDQGVRGGDDKKDRQYKGFLSFDTTSLPDGAILRTATLRLSRETVSGSNPFATHGTMSVDVQIGGFSGSTVLEATDFEATATAPASAAMSDAPADLDWSEGTLDAAGLDALNVTGTTQLRISFQLDDNDDSGEDSMEYYPGDDVDPANHPQLVVEYLN